MRRVPLNLYAGLIPALCVWCYLYYPAWRTVGPLVAIEGTPVYLALFIVSLVLLIKLAVTLCDDNSAYAVGPGASIGPPQSDPVRWPGYALGLLIIGFFIAQWQFIDLEVLSGPDEPVHVFGKLMQWQGFIKNGSMYPALAFAFASVASVLCFACFAIPIRGVGRKELLINILLIFALFAVLIGLTEAIKAAGAGWGTALRFPPLRNITIQPALLVFGATEIGVRVVSTIFGALTALIVYKIFKDDGEPAAGLVGAAICLTCPTFFAYAHLDYRDIGGAFFVAACVYCVLSYLRTWNPMFLSIGCCAVAAGYLERRPVAIMLLICGLAVAVEFIVAWRSRNKGETMSFTSVARLVLSRGLFLLSTIVAVAPWIYVTRHVRPYVFHPENFLELKYVFAYIKILSSTFVWPVLIMLTAGIIVLVVKRKLTGIVALLAFGIFYVLFTGDQPRWIPQGRFVVNFIPCLAVISACSVAWIRSPRSRGVVAVLCTLPMIAGLAGWSANTPTLMLQQTDKLPADYPRYPVDQIVDSVVAEGLRNPRFCFPRKIQSSIRYYWFRAYSNDRVQIVRPVKKGRQRRPTLESIQMLCNKETTDYLVLAFAKKPNSDKFWPSQVRGVRYIHVEENTIEGFEVVYVHDSGRYKLAALKPL